MSSLKNSAVFLICLSFFSFRLLLSQGLVLNKLDQTTGLSNELNMHFTIDRTGFFWTSSRDGLNRFDGHKVKLYRPSIADLNLDPNITSKVFQDKYNNYWFSSSTALNRLTMETDSIESWQFSTDKNSYHYVFHLERDSFIWMIADKKIYRLDIHAAIQPKEALHAYNTYTAYALEDESGVVKQIASPLVEHRKGFEILTYDDHHSPVRDSFFTDSTQTNLPPTFIPFLEIESPQSFWIPSPIGLIHFNPERPFNSQLYTHKDAGRLDYRDVAGWSERYLWVATWGEGLLLFDKYERDFVAHYPLFLIEDQLRNLEGIAKIYVDQQENLWISVLDQGLFYLSLKNLKFEQLFSLDEISRQPVFRVTSIFESPEGNIHYMTENQGVFTHSIVANNELEDPFQQAIQCCCRDKKIWNTFIDGAKDIWILTDSSVVVWNPETNECNQILNAANRAVEMIQLTEREFVIMDLNHLHIVYKGQEFRTANQGLQAIECDLPAQLFYDSASKLVLLSQGNNTFRMFDLEKGFLELPSVSNVGIVNGISPSSQGNFFWLASSTGLHKFDPTKRSANKISGNTGQLNRAFTDVVEDSLGNIWLSSYWGIYRYLPKTDSVQHFTQSDGLLSMQYNENSSLCASNGSIYFGGDRGITVIDPYRVQLNSNLPKINLIDCRINNQPVDKRLFQKGSRSQELQYNQNSLTFEFAILEFSDPNLNQISYCLIRDGKDTITIGNSNPVTFNLLAPGEYQLDLYAANSDNVWTHTPKSYYFDIRPPWYQTRTARIIAWFALIALIYGLYRYRLYQIRKQETFKRKEAEFKQREAEYKQLVAETETAVLRLQMNPHFIFNSMNSISSYILQKDIDTANDYLHRFSRLMRRILELSEQAFTDVTEEIDLLTLYLKTESMRLRQSLEYHFDIHPDIDPDDTLLPTMILQPFVENAIWHGISPKAETGLIQIRFLPNNGHLLCEVEDNGVGRSSPQKMKTNLHASKALSITQRRLDLLSKKQTTQAHLNIVDLVDPNNQPIGTKIQLFLPTLE